MRQIDKQRLSTIEPDLRQVVNRCIERGNKFIVLYGIRTLAEQKALYAQGRTTKGKIVTWTIKSRHLPNKNGLSEAVDLAPIKDDGSVDWNDLRAFDRLGAEMKASAKEVGVAITWGGDWVKRKDRPHFELTNRK